MQVERFVIPAGDTYVIQTGMLPSGELLVGTFEVAGGDLNFELRDPEGRCVERQPNVLGAASFALRIVVPGPYHLRFGNLRSWLRSRSVALRLQGYAVAAPDSGRQGERRHLWRSIKSGRSSTRT